MPCDADWTSHGARVKMRRQNFNSKRAVQGHGLSRDQRGSTQPPMHYFLLLRTSEPGQRLIRGDEWLFHASTMYTD